MKQGSLYFISDEFYEKHDPGHELMQNKEDGHGRPCFYVFQDEQESAVFWCVPISSKVAKYKEKVKEKLEKQAARGIPHPQCNTIRFGTVLGKEKAFLIQNIFPVTERYVTNAYIDKNTGSPVVVPKATNDDIQRNARKVLRLVLRNHHTLVYGKIDEIRANLIAELQQERQQEQQKEANVQLPDYVKKKIQEIQLRKQRGREDDLER